MDKILTIYSKFPDEVPNIQSVQKPKTKSKIHILKRATEDKIKKLILGSSLSDLDHVPTNVLKNSLNILVTPITNIINISFETSKYP